jgi:hypothetical protein
MADLEPPAFLLKVDGCVLHRTFKALDNFNDLGERGASSTPLGYLYDESNREQKGELGMSQVQYIPCYESSRFMFDQRVQIENDVTVAGFNIGEDVVVDAYFALGSSLLIILLMISISVLIGRDKVIITEVVVAPLTKVNFKYIKNIYKANLFLLPYSIYKFSFMFDGVSPTTPSRRITHFFQHKINLYLLLSYSFPV